MANSPSVESPSGETWTREDLVGMVADILETEVLRSDLDLDRTSGLEESGLDSLKLTQVLLSVEERTGLWLDEENLTPENLETVGTLADCIYDVLEE